jgi:hypothetical protein
LTSSTSNSSGSMPSNLTCTSTTKVFLARNSFGDVIHEHHPPILAVVHPCTRVVVGG